MHSHSGAALGRVQGGVYWIGAGIGIFIGSPIIDIAAVFGSMILGEYIGVGGKATTNVLQVTIRSWLRFCVGFKT